MDTTGYNGWKKKIVWGGGKTSHLDEFYGKIDDVVFQLFSDALTFSGYAAYGFYKI